MFGLGLTEYIPFVSYITCIFAIILTLFYKAEIGLYFITFLIPFQNLIDKLIKYPLGKDMMDILFIATIISIFVHKNKDNIIVHDKSVLISIILLIFGSYFSLWVGHSKLGLPMPISYESNQFIQWKNFIMLPLLYFMTVKIIKDKKQIILIIWIMVVAVFMTDVYFYNDARWYDYSSYSQDLRKVARTFSYLGPNEFATFLALMSMFMIGFFSLDKFKIRKFIFLSVIFFNFYCILYLFSRGTYFASLAGLLFLGIIKTRKILLLVLVLLLSWHTVLPNAVIERVEMTRTDEGLDASSQSRLDMWSKALEAIKINPITGIGFGGTVYLGIEKGTPGGFRKNIHNGYLAVLIEQGFLGLFILLYISSIAIRKSWILFSKAKDNQVKGIGLGFLAMIVVSLFENLTGTNWHYLNVMGYFWIIFGLVVRAYHIDCAEKENEPIEPSLAG